MKNFIVSLGIILISVVVTAQENIAFRTLATKGTVIVQRGTNPDQYIPVTSGLKIFSSDKIIITGNDCYVSLVTPEGSAVELQKNGVYNVADLQKALASNKSDLLEKYMNLLAEDISKADQSTGKNMKYTGAVERSLRNNDILVFLPETTKISLDNAVIKWYPKTDATRYVVKITDIYDQMVYSTKTSSNALNIDFKELSLKPGQVYKLSVINAENPSMNSGVVSLYVPARSEIAKIEGEIERLKQEVPPNSAIGDMLIATYLEDHGMYLNAIPYYESAIQKEPEIVEYRMAYNNFLHRIGLAEADN